MKKSFDPITSSDAKHLTEIYMLCNQYDLEIKISKTSLKIFLPCGGEASAEFDPIGDRFEAESLLYKQLKAVKAIVREIKDNCFNEESLKAAYLNGGV